MAVHRIDVRTVQGDLLGSLPLDNHAGLGLGCVLVFHARGKHRWVQDCEQQSASEDVRAVALPWARWGRSGADSTACLRATDEQCALLPEIPGWEYAP